MFESYRERMKNQGGQMGKALKRQSDMIMDATFKRDIAYRVCYLQDRDCHFPKQTAESYLQAKSVFMGETEYDPTELDGFTPIEAKYLVKSYYSIQSDTVDYYLQFRPNVHGTNTNIRVGAYVFIPDDLGVYNLWMIVAKDDRPQFPQFYVLRCDFIAKWHISEQDSIRYEGVHVDTGSYFSWAVARIQSSYNSGVWTDYLTTSVENQKKLWLPDNKDTQLITYNEHITISMNPLRRTSWEVTKYVDTEPAGLVKLTLAQQLEYSSRDNLSWVNTFSNELSPIDKGNAYDFYEPHTNDHMQHTPVDETIANDNLSIISFSGVSPDLKCGGSYKTYTANLSQNGSFVDAQPSWSISYVVNNEVQHTIYLEYDGTTLVPRTTDNQFVITKDRKISYLDNFAIQYLYHADKPQDLKLKCLSNLHMIGNKILITAEGPMNLGASIEVEVTSL